MEAFIKKLSSQGINYENLKHEPNAVTIRPDGIKQIYIKDPDGHWVEVNDAQR
jgi:lactoylglutathione lyase